MTDDELVVELEGDEELLVVKLRGSLDIATSASVRATLIDAVESKHRGLIVDLTRLEFLDSTGLGALIGAQRRAAERGTALRLVIGDGPVARLLEITGLMRVFAVYHTIENARADRRRVSAH